MTDTTGAAMALDARRSVFTLADPLVLSGTKDDYHDAGNPDALSLAEGTVSLAFNADDLSGTRALFSKDANGFSDGGHLTVRIVDGVLEVRQQSTTASEKLRLTDLPIETGKTYHVAVSFGDDGLKVYLNGQLAAAEPEFKQGIDTNEEALAIGASTMHRQNPDASLRDFFDGTISSVAVYDSQLSPVEMAALAGETDPAFEEAALDALSFEDILPAFAQLHHASDTLKALAAQYGIGHDGAPIGPVKLSVGTDGEERIGGWVESNANFGGRGNDSLGGGSNTDYLQGGYGNDTVNGGDDDDVLDGGHGEDTIIGGAGNDLLISQADGREPFVTEDPDRDEGDPYNELDPATGKLYPDQPIPADDIFIGGSGADIFYFQTLINAKERFIEEHTNDDGTIRWHGVAGENENVHDHWVDEIGDDVIMDFSHAEGDRIIIEGHTTEIASVTHGDENGDGVIDHSLITLYSDQGNGGGAHNDDWLGTIKVFGDLITEADIEQTAQPAYGIVQTIDRLDEALAPVDIAPDTGPIAPPDDLPGTGDLGTVNGTGPVFGLAGSHTFDGDRDNHVQVAHSEALEVPNGTLSLAFTADDVTGKKALFSKDGNGFDAGGHLSVWVKDGELLVRQQSTEASEHLKIPGVTIAAGQTYHLAVSFGDDGLKIYLDGTLVAAEPEFKQGLETNERALLVGATGAYRMEDDQRPHDAFVGTISDVALFDSQVSPVEAAALAGETDPAFEEAALEALSFEDILPAFAQLHHASDTLKTLAAQYGIGHDGAPIGPVKLSVGTDGEERIGGWVESNANFGGRGNDSLGAGSNTDYLHGGYGNDTVNGGGDDDVLDGGHGEDTLIGGGGDDLLISRSDGREPFVTEDPDRDEGDPYDELDPATGKLYPDQPIPADDIMIGGSGADIFYFQTLINAKERFIEEHTNDDGTIRWHGVAGENENVHDHWVDEIGDDVIMDYSRAEGDRIIIEGHTTEIASVTHGDENGDGVIDHSLITLYSDQGGGGGAHNDDWLGTIKVYGDLITESDIEQTAKPAYGIVQTIDRLDEALAPVDIAEDTGPIAPPDDLPAFDGLEAATGAEVVFGLAGPQDFSGDRDDVFAQMHSDALALEAGTIAFSFNADTITGRDALFSKDAHGFGEGGHLSAFVGEDGALKVRFQTDQGEKWFRVADAVEAGKEYDFAFTFGSDGAFVYLDGVEVASDTAYTQDWSTNEEVLLIGANGWASESGEIGHPSDPLDGEIADFVILDDQLDAAQVQALPGLVDEAFL
ncbi:MAG: LamG domain-containing protein [Pseudomonadota bacterium]